VAQLSVNLNKIAVVRNSRGGHRPSVVDAAKTVITAGAYGVTVHPRPDQRHIRPDDVANLAKLLNDDYPGVEFKIEGNPHAPATTTGYPGMDSLIEHARPAQATLVPDADAQLTSDHGWDLTQFNEPLARSIERYQQWGARVSLFMDPDPELIAQAKAHGADRVELYTGPFAQTVWQYGLTHARSIASFELFQSAARYASQIGLGVNAGHDLDQQNLRLFRDIKEVDEVSIGHALISDALESGLSDTVRAYLQVLAGS